MTKNEIKQQYTMRDIVERYGLHPNRAGFVRCPFHTGDRTASMKIYDYDAYCFGCGWHGDIFSFVQQIDGCSFKEAFLILGGEYRKATPEMRQAIRKGKQAVYDRKRKELERKSSLQKCIRDIDWYRNEVDRWEPMSDKWCFSMNELQKLLYKHGELTGVPY